MKNRTKISLVLISVFALLLTACGEPGGGDPYPHLSNVDKLTYSIPNELTNEEKNAIATKLNLVVGHLNTKAGEDATFKEKINAILARGLTITLEKADSLNYGIKAVDGNKHLMAESSYIIAMTDLTISNVIIEVINTTLVVQAIQQSAKEAVRMAKAPVNEAWFAKQIFIHTLCERCAAVRFS
ncbi:MAG: hypothetical protein FWD28_09065 [Treponema sp.]|nr:hypothetical protein [Treponema sp.]